MPTYPERIVCLSEETTETLYAIGAGDRVVGVSGYTMRPPEARQKPKVSAFISARYDAIAALEPDLILAFSDLQADIVAELVRRGYAVVTFNQRSIDGILQMIRMLGGLVGCEDRARDLSEDLQRGLAAIVQSAGRLPRRPRVFFEEWHNPLISGIQWVEELIELAGGDPIFPALRHESLAMRRIVDAGAVRDRAPDVILASWCGKRVRKPVIAARPGWADTPAVRDGHIYEIRSTYLLQPGPAALTEGVRQIHAILSQATGIAIEPALRPDAPWDQTGSRSSTPPYSGMHAAPTDIN